MLETHKARSRGRKDPRIAGVGSVGLPEGQEKSLVGAANDLKQDAAAEGGVTDTAKLFGERWKKAAAGRSQLHGYAERPGDFPISTTP